MRTLSIVFACAALAACGDVVVIDNATPQVTLEGICSADGRAYVLLDAIDHEGLDLDLQLVTAAGSIAPGPTGAGLLGLRTLKGPEAAHHRIEWSRGIETIEGAGEVDPCAALKAAELPGPAVTNCVLYSGGEHTIRIWAFDEAVHDLGEQTVVDLGECP